MNNIEFLLSQCEDVPELYNKVANLLWCTFGMKSAEISMLCTYIAKECLEDEHRERNAG